MSWRDKYREDWLEEFDDDGVIAVQVNIKSDRYWPDSLKLDAAKRYVLYVEAEQNKQIASRAEKRSNWALWIAGLALFLTALDKLF